MSAEEERWAEALAIDRLHGRRARTHVEERLAALGLAGDMAGVARWRAIGDRLDRLARPGRWQ